MGAIDRFGDGLWLAAQMAWEVGWALVLGFLLSGAEQAWVPRRRLERVLGRSERPRARARRRPRRRVVLLQLRGGRDRALAVHEGRERRGRDGVPVRVDELRLRARASSCRGVNGKVYGGRTAATLVAIMFGAMVVASLAVDGLFSLLGPVPQTRSSTRSRRAGSRGTTRRSSTSWRSWLPPLSSHSPFGVGRVTRSAG